MPPVALPPHPVTAVLRKAKCSHASQLVDRRCLRSTQADPHTRFAVVEDQSGDVFQLGLLEASIHPCSLSLEGWEVFGSCGFWSLPWLVAEARLWLVQQPPSWPAGASSH